MSSRVELEQVIKEAKAEISEIDRDDKAKELVSGVTIFEKTIATVQNISGKVYEVNIQKQTCECPDHQFRDTKCKHIRAVNIFLTELLETQRGRK